MFKLVFIAIFIFNTHCLEEEIELDYYWRDYFGVVPPDAVFAGRTVEGQKVYIGQAYVKNAGLIVAQINPGVKEVYATIGGIVRVDKYIKILCGESQYFNWMIVNSTSFHTLVADKHPVLGGHEDAYGYMHIGRLSQGGNTVVGKVNSFWNEAYLLYNGSGVEITRKETYEALMYNKPTTY